VLLLPLGVQWDLKLSVAAIMRSPEGDKSEQALTNASSHEVNGLLQEKEAASVTIPSTQLQQLIETNLSLCESNVQIKDVLIQVSALLADPSRFLSYPSSRTTTFSIASNKTRKSEDSAESDGKSGVHNQDPLRHALDTESVRQMIIQNPGADKDNDLSPMSKVEIEKENTEFREIYRCTPDFLVWIWVLHYECYLPLIPSFSGQICPDSQGDLARSDPHLDWWAKVSEYLEHLYELYRYGKDAIPHDIHLPGLEISREAPESRRYSSHDVISCLYDTTRSEKLSTRRSTSTSTTILGAHEFGQSFRLVSIIRRIFNLLPSNVIITYSLHEITGVLVHLGRINQKEYEKEFWRTWWESETGHASPLLIAHNLESIRKECYSRNIFRLYGRDPKSFRERDLRLIWAVAQAMLFFKEDIPKPILHERRMHAPIGEFDLFLHSIGEEETFRPLVKSASWSDTAKGGKTFITAHLSVKTLKELGSVQVRWTHEFSDHLRFEQAGETGQLVLWLFWDVESLRRTRLHVKL
jgi:hypothetical protein